MENNEELDKGKVVRSAVEVRYIKVVPDPRFKGDLFSVAVGYDKNGSEVKAVILENYKYLPTKKGVPHRRVLQEKANKIFGLAQDPETQSTG
jgi:hypothetical protein